MRLSYFLFLLSCCCGCYPYRALDRPGVTGRVVDSQTGVPLAGAQVKLIGALVATSQRPRRKPDWYVEQARSYPGHSANTLTAADGSFNFTPVQSWSLWEIHFSRWGTFYELSVARESYHSYTNIFWHPIEIDSASQITTNWGTIRLTGQTK